MGCVAGRSTPGCRAPELHVRQIHAGAVIAPISTFSLSAAGPPAGEGPPGVSRGDEVCHVPGLGSQLDEAGWFFMDELVACYLTAGPNVFFRGSKSSFDSNADSNPDG